MLNRVEEIERRAPGVPADVVVVGAGYAGVELASTVAERLGSRAAVQLVSAGPHTQNACCQYHSYTCCNLNIVVTQ